VKIIGARLGKPKRWRLEEEQEYAVADISRRNNKIKMCQVLRAFCAIGIRVTDLNGGILPVPEQVRIQRALIHRAHRDRKRSR
jgi:hypothetical protein